MLAPWVIVVVSVGYLALLFAVAHHADRRARAGRSIVGNATVYALSLAVYATSWTFYGSVGRAATEGLSFLTIYLGPTLAIALGWLVLRKMIRVAQANRITSLADFVSMRYGKSALLGALVAGIAVVGVVPYIALQLKAVSMTYQVLVDGPGRVEQPGSILSDKALYVALVLAAFAMLFGARRLDAAERHEGMVAAIAFESVVKLVAFLAVGVFVVFGVFDGFGDIFARAAERPEIARLFTLTPEVSPGEWGWLMLLSTLAFFFLPRQFQVAVVENVRERHLDRAMWLFPLYLLAINLFVLPVAFAGLLTYGTGGPVSPDTFVLALPLSEGSDAVALLVFIGGLSAATGMVIVETVALSTMVSNSIVMPLLSLRWPALLHHHSLPVLLLRIRRLAIVGVLLLGYAYFRVAGEAPALVDIGLVSFAAVAQFAPAILGGMFWRGATRRGAMAGLLIGFACWYWMLVVPALARSGWLDEGLLRDGPFGIDVLRPTAFLGLDGLDEISHAMFWSLLANTGLFVGFSLSGRMSPAEHGQAALFVDALRPRGTTPPLWRGRATVGQLAMLVERTLGGSAARRFTGERDPAGEAGGRLVHHAETLLAGALGPASARAMVAAAVEEETLELRDVVEMLDETVAYSRRLEEKSRELEAATADLRAANRRLQELDRLKDDFVSSVTHELRTPLTSIRSFSEILYDTPELDVDKRREFLRIVISETERLTRLINRVLDLSKLESGAVEWSLELVDVRELAGEALTATEQLARDRRARLRLEAPEAVPLVEADRDRLQQVLLNLLSNAVKFCDAQDGDIVVRIVPDDGELRVEVCDNGAGVPPDLRDAIFEKFRQAGALAGNPTGTGLGLPISREIVARLGGAMWVEGEPGRGATFVFTLPAAAASAPGAGAEAAAGAGAEAT